MTDSVGKEKRMEYESSKHSGNSDRVRANFLFNSLYQLSGIIIPLVTLPYLTRIIHAKGLGEYSFAYSAAFYFYLFIRLGLQNYGNRTIAYVKDDLNVLRKVFSELYTFQVIMCLVLSLLYLLYCMTLSPNKVLAYIFMLHVLAGGVDVTWALYGLEEFRITAIRDIATKAIVAILIFLMVKDSEDVWKYALIYCLGFFVSQAVSLPVLLRRVKYVKPEIKGMVSHIKPNLLLFLPTVAVSLYKTMDKIMLGSMSSETELGYYHSSEKIIMVPLALITALGTVMLPRMSNMISNEVDDNKVSNLFNKSIIFAMFLSTSLCMGIMTVSKEFVLLYFGEGFEKCGQIFLIILPSCIFLAFANVIRTQNLIPRKKDSFFIISLFSGAAVNLTLNFLLIPRYASIGAAIGTLVAEITVCVIQAAYVYKEADIRRNIIDSVPFVAAGLVMFIVCHDYSFRTTNPILALFVKILLSGLFYLIIVGALLGIKTIIKKRSGNS
jgi:O-antigen/teichoic acid export membrane protein